MLPGAPSLWIIGVLVAALPVTYAVTKLRANLEVRAAYEQGKQAGLASASTSTVAEAGKTAAAERAAEAATPLVRDQPAIDELCRRSASCRERDELRRKK